MKAGIKIFIALMLLAGTGSAFAAKNSAPAPADPAAAKEAKEAGFRDILTKLMRQDEELDEALQKLDSVKPLTPHEIQTMGLTLKRIGGNLNYISSMNKREFSAIEPEAGVDSYTNAVLSYSRKVDRKTALISALAARLTTKNKKSAMRDAVASKKYKKTGGKKIAQLLEEQTAAAGLAADAKKLRGASRNLSATSKWLYIASK